MSGIIRKDIYTYEGYITGLNIRQHYGIIDSDINARIEWDINITRDDEDIYKFICNNIFSHPRNGSHIHRIVYNGHGNMEDLRPYFKERWREGKLYNKDKI